MGCALSWRIDRRCGSSPAFPGNLAPRVHGMSDRNQDEMHRSVGRTIERVARESYGRLVAYLSVHTHDLASAEDALSEALVSALETWPQNGLPTNPEAWLLTAARRSLIDVIRHQRVVVGAEPTLVLLKENSMEPASSTAFPDERLKLLFVCAHPSIDPAMHTPLMFNPRPCASGFSARRRRFATAASRSKFRKSAICRSASMPYLRRSTLLSESAGMTCLALTSVAAIWLRKPSGLRGFWCSSCPTRQKFKVCWH